ncbi:hypothetical protein C492_10615 [Natronococcus jeotgali DSM 18795]|uniref:Uncharacterized protein n=1 Tax=Natronococcus jeotgali DSM 18795 TaxID=1227498 RepID=L9XF66_9EURY|nr:hypothetical protein C492_10615 [Natronococcus jeotgali DSM 18795]
MSRLARLSFDFFDRFLIEGITDSIAKPFDRIFFEWDKLNPIFEFDDSISITVFLPDFVRNNDSPSVVSLCRFAHRILYYRGNSQKYSHCYC